MPLYTQAKVLRAIQNKEIKPLGATKTIKVDVRIIAATNKNIKEEIKKKNFREDLWHRLNVFSINLPPLKKRKNDIPLLAYHFLKKFNHELNKNIRDISKEVMIKLMNYDWQGNIRELENAIERMVVLEDGEYLSLENLRDEIKNADLSFIISKKINSYENNGYDITDFTLKEAKKKCISSFEINYILKLLKKTDGNISKAARLAGVDRSNFRKLIRKYDL
jgi:DNA-binding NtrC family response regulator